MQEGQLQPVCERVAVQRQVVFARWLLGGGLARSCPPMAVQETAIARYGRPSAEVRSRLLRMKGALSGGTAATARETVGKMLSSPQVAALLRDPFALTPGFRGPEQPDGEGVRFDPDIARTVGPILMAAINTTPLVDVMLVLLIIFLITIPVVNYSVPVDLPKERNQIGRAHV